MNHKNWDQRAKNNFKALLPNLNQHQIDALTQRMWDNIGRVMTELSVLDRIARDKRRVRVVGEEHLAAASKAKRPLLALTLHTGSWEISPTVLVNFGLNTKIIYQPPRSEARHALARKARARCGGVLLPPGPAGARPAVKHLKGGGCLVMAIDEFVNGRVHAPFLGRSPKAIGNIAKVRRFVAFANAVPVIVHSVRTGGANFEVHITPLPDLPTEVEGDDAGLAWVVALDRSVERIVMANLEQWFMLHDFRLDR